MTLNYLYKRSLPINDDISIYVPTVGEIVDDEDNYYTNVTMLTAMPIDLMVMLDDAGIDFTKINDYDLFLLLFSNLRENDTHLIFGDLDLTKFDYFVNKQNDMVVLFDKEDNIMIDRAIYGKIAWALRKIHHLEKNRRKPANQEALEFMLMRAREKAKRNKNRKYESQIESLIIAMVNAEQFKYDFETIREVTIYQFNESVRQIIKKVDYDNRMYGVYAGTIDAKKLSQDDLNWLIHK